MYEYFVSQLRFTLTLLILFEIISLVILTAEQETFPGLFTDDTDYQMYSVLHPPPEAFMSTPQLIVKYGYHVEEHHVRTDDGYILTLFRIPHGRKSPHISAHRGPALLQHGLLCSSNDWLLQLNKNNNLPDLGYDVWLGNCRGNNYSMRHETLSPDNLQFWKFSFDEMGRYDIPAVFDHILRASRSAKLTYIGHSMGNTMLFIAVDYYPEIGDKISKLIALAPVAYVHNAITPLRLIADTPSPIYEFAVDIFNDGRIFPSKLNKFMKILGPYICDPIGEIRCSNFMFYVVGYDKEQGTEWTDAMVVSHTPSDASGRTLNHYLQWVRSATFQKYDYGVAGNLKRYYSKIPPLYNLSAVRVPTYAFYAPNDWLTVPQDSVRAIEELGNVVAAEEVNFRDFNHLDFLYAKDVKKLLYDKVLQYLMKP